MEYTLPSLRVVKSDRLGHFCECPAFGSERLDRPVHFINQDFINQDFINQDLIPEEYERVSYSTVYTTCRPSIPVLEGGRSHSARTACGADLVQQQIVILSLLSDDLPWPEESMRLLKHMAEEVVFDSTTPSLVVGLECLGALALTEASQTADRSMESIVVSFHAMVRDAAIREALWNTDPEASPAPFPVYNLMTFREYADHHASDDIVPSWRIQGFITRAEKAREMHAGGGGAW